RRASDQFHISSVSHSFPPCVTVSLFFFFSSRRRHTRLQGDWSSDVCSSDLGNDVIFTGYLESTAKLAVMREADMIVNPSLIEPFGLVALEAMSLAKPIVASATGGLVDILSDGHTASLVHPGDSKNLAAVLVRLMHNENDRQLLSSISAKHAVKYSWNNVIDDYTDLYRSVGRKRLFERLSVANDNEAN